MENLWKVYGKSMESDNYPLVNRDITIDKSACYYWENSRRFDGHVQ